MKIFAIRDEEQSMAIDLGYLIYYEKAKSFYIELPENADPWETPLLLSSFVKRGEYTVNAYWSKLWVQQRIVPQDRQNLGQILKENGLKEYDEFALLTLAHGRCAQDNYHLVEIAEEDLPPEIVERWLKKIEDVVPLAERQLLVFFRDGLVKKCDIRALVKAKPAFAPILNSDKLFRSVGVQMGGYGICWGEQLTMSDDDLYRHGVDVPLSMDDFRSFIADRVVNSAEAQQMLGCTRQNINDLIRRGKLHPIREDSKNKLFLKNEIQQRIQK